MRFWFRKECCMVNGYWPVLVCMWLIKHSVKKHVWLGFDWMLMEFQWYFGVGFRVAGIINNVKELWRVFLTHLQRKHSNSKKNHFVKSKSREILEKVSLCTGNAQQHSHRALKSIKFQHCCFIEILWSNKLENSCLKHTEKVKLF